MGLVSSLGRLVLVTINMVFLLVGIGLLVMGLIVRFGQQIYKPLLAETLKILETTGQNISKDFKFNADELGNILMSLSVGLIVGGIVLSAFTLFGCCGGCYKNKCMLFLYGVIIVVLLVAEIIVIGLLYGKKDIIKQPLKDGLKDYRGANGTDLLSLGWNIVMLQFQCCGVDNYTDFSAGKYWKTTTYNGTLLTFSTPPLCCKEPAKNLPTCALSTFNEAVSNAYIGCFNKIWDISLGNITMAVGILVACGVFQILLIAFAYIIYKSSDKVNPV
ncbi:hypothetical protein CHS0354_042475 [Potamilus streckersoni]|uniref:Tetraspanin n=1 Tax=Potamilus streckersoni TaxID=2493646 RepID=A0AAE0S987_9BIVA|nr:hypothetical protein CHS0354_042475 [Potamilus streckersoni]